MPIDIVCTGCKKRFSVNEKFAGQEGPCPNCKTLIQIPALDDQVVVHSPEGAGPKDSAGRAVLVPILREETQFSTKMAVVIAVSIVLVFILSAVIGRSFPDGELPVLLKALAALALGPPLAIAGYALLRNDELEAYTGQELWIRTAACGVAYAFLWGVYAWIQYVLELDFDIYQLVYVVPPLILAGGFAAFASLDLDYTSGLMHYAFYLIVTVLLRFVAGMEAF